MTGARCLLWVLLGALTMPAQASLAQTGRGGPPGTQKAEAEGTAVVRGRITAARSGRPLRRAQVRLFASPTQRFSTSTNVRGEYEFRHVPEGRYTLTVTRSGYLSTQYGQRRIGEPPGTLEVAAGQHLQKVDISLARASAISGRVFDETGEVLPGVMVYAMRPAFFQGRRRLAPSGPHTTTDDTGMFRISGLEPDEYYVMAILRETWTVKGPPPQTLGYAATYFPGAVDENGAQRVEVGAEQEVPAIDFALVASRTAALSGIALTVDGTPAAGVQVSLNRSVIGPGGGSILAVSSAKAAADGTWRIADIPPGEYELAMYTEQPGRGRGRVRTATTLVVREADVEGLVLAADPGAPVSGEVRTHDGQPLPGTGARRVLFSPVGPDQVATPIMAGDETGLIDSQGRFTTLAASGPNVVRVSGLPPGWAIRDVELGGRDYAGAAIEVAAGEPLDGIRIVVTNRLPALAGRITDGNGGPVAGTVVLFPADESQWLGVADNIRTARADETGMFRFTTVRPGDYLAVALDFVKQGEVTDPAFLRGIARAATRVSVAEGQNAELNLRIGR